MKNFLSGVLLAAGVVTTSLAGAAYAADLTPQPVLPISAASLENLQNAYRASQIIGASVVNEDKEVIGKIDDLLINRSDDVPYAVISVGGFLGLGEKNVAVPYKALQITGDSLMLKGGSKDALKALPEFKYRTS